MVGVEHVSRRGLGLKLDPRTLAFIALEVTIDTVLVDRSAFNNLVAGVSRDRADVGQREALLAVIIVHCARGPPIRLRAHETPKGDMSSTCHACGYLSRGGRSEPP